MTFWTSQQLERQLPRLVDKYSDSRVDCNSYTLCIGDEIYVSPTDETPNPRITTIRRLQDSEAFTIPPGQFAFLITDESIEVPVDAMAFISMKAKIKLKGLVNVSGFHVDPGFKGKLTFSVFNAGPTSVHLKRGQECFLIWYASLTEASEKHKSGEYGKALSTDLVNSLPGELQSFEGLSKRIRDLERRLNERVNQLEPKYADLNAKRTILITVVTAVLAILLKSAFDALAGKS